MPVNVDHLKQRISEALESKAELNRLALKRTPQSYSQCFKIMEEEGICNCAKDLTAITRLRNLLTHRYWAIDDAQIYDSIKNNFKAIDKLLGSVKDRYAINL